MKTELEYLWNLKKSDLTADENNRFEKIIARYNFGFRHLITSADENFIHNLYASKN